MPSVAVLQAKRSKPGLAGVPSGVMSSPSIGSVLTQWYFCEYCAQEPSAPARSQTFSPMGWQPLEARIWQLLEAPVAAQAKASSFFQHS